MGFSPYGKASHSTSIWISRIYGQTPVSTYAIIASKPKSTLTMGLKVPRSKKRIPLLSMLYRLDQWLPFSSKRKLGWYLDLEWIFDRLAMEHSFRHYSKETHPHRRFANNFLLAHVSPDMAVLDLGCKYGDTAVVLAERAGRVVGVDHDGGAIAEARRRHQRPNLEFQHEDALEYLTKQHTRFDLLVLSHILEHIDEPAKFLSRFKDHFQFIYIELPDFDKSYLNHYRLDLGKKLIYTDDDHVSEFDREELQALLSSLGIKVINAEYRFGLQRLWCQV